MGADSPTNGTQRGPSNITLRARGFGPSSVEGDRASPLPPNGPSHPRARTRQQPKSWELISQASRRLHPCGAVPLHNDSLSLWDAYPHLTVTRVTPAT